jgi:biofilm PGA synthesis N-glycosyltransferase PgaC
MSTGLLIAFVLFTGAMLQAFIIASWRTAIAKSTSVRSDGGHEPPGITVVVPARDEERGIALVLQDLHGQAYPKDRCEVIVVDDGSSDRTMDIVRGMQSQWSQLRLSPNRGVGKKAAITTGVEEAKHPFILLTDADARCGQQRLSQVANALRDAEMVILPVRTDGDGVLGRLQAIEQAAFLGMCMGTALNGTPVLAYGANLAFTREAFHEVRGFSGDRFASGDDLFLLRRMQSQGKRTCALLSREVLVTTEAVGSWGAFLAQRLRWAGKMRGAIGATSLLGALALALPWLILFATMRFNLVASIGQQGYYQLLLIASTWLVWLLPPLGLVRDVQGALGVPSSALKNLMALLAFSVYAPVIAVLSLVIRPKWKGRKA